MADNRDHHRVALFSPSLRGGGAERSAVNLANGLADAGLGVDLVLVRAEGPYLEQVSSGVRVVELKCSRTLFALLPLVRYLRRECPCALLAYQEHVSLLALLAKAVARAPVRIFPSVRTTWSESAQHKWLIRLAKVFYPFAAGVVAVSSGAAEDVRRLTGLPAHRVHVIYNPVISPELSAMSAEPPKNPEWLGAGKVVIAIGRLVPEKGFDCLIRAFERVSNAGDTTRLLLLGEGPERESLEKLVANLGLGHTVDMPGFVQNPYAYLSRSNVFVLSSRFEGLPTVLIEAMALGIPLVSTDCRSGPREILQNGKLGKLVTVGDVDGLAQAIAEALENPVRPADPEALAPYQQLPVVQQYKRLLLGDCC